jgi:antitoxin VapB
MALNIKNEEAHRLASQLAAVTGTTMSEAVTTAVRETLARRTADPDVNALLAEVKELQRFLSDLPDRDRRSADEILGYDEFGLPG